MLINDWETYAMLCPAYTLIYENLTSGPTEGDFYYAN